MPEAFQAPVTTQDLGTGSALVGAREQQNSRVREEDVTLANAERQRITEALKKAHKAELTGDVAMLLAFAAPHIIKALSSPPTPTAPATVGATPATTLPSTNERAAQGGGIRMPASAGFKVDPVVSPTVVPPSGVDRVMPYARSLSLLAGQAFGAPSDLMKNAVGVGSLVDQNNNLADVNEYNRRKALRDAMRREQEMGDAR